MAAPALHSDQVGLNIIVGENIRLAGRVGLLTDAQVVAATTVQSLKDAVDLNAGTAHSDVQGYVGRLKRAFDYGKDDGTLTDANIAAATSLENLAQLSLATGTGPILE